MTQALHMGRMAAEQDERISETVAREQSRLRNFIRSRVADRGDAEDILQEVFYELVVAYRLMEPIEQAGAWLFRVARNRITDLLRKKKPERLLNQATTNSEGEALLLLEEVLPSLDAGPEALYARGVLLKDLEVALSELPREQREVFLAHEVEGRSFKEMAAESGVSMNTLLGRKRYAVLALREKLRSGYEDFTEESGGRER